MQRLKKKCKTFGCPNLHTNTNGYCDECNRKWREKHPIVEKDDRPSASRRGYNYKWQKFSRDFLALHPTCAICGAPARVCDHKNMTADMMMDAYGAFDLDPAHYQALCYRCNTRKGAREDKAMRKAYLRDKQYLYDILKEGEG